MRTYGQYCPIARGSEVVAERWTPIILRNLLAGCHTFNEIAAGAPGLSRALLARRLRELERVGVLVIRPKPDGHGSLYEPTPAGSDLSTVLHALGGWAEKWTELTREHADPDYVLWSWCKSYMRHDLLPEERVVVRFEFHRGKRRINHWLLIEKHDAEVCRIDPGFGDDVEVVVADPLPFARWHAGLLSWSAALRSGGIKVTGRRELCRALPTWNEGPQVIAERRARLTGEGVGSTVR
jgi:DNA-binding HxlR family transcriptional regulator